MSAEKDFWTSRAFRERLDLVMDRMDQRFAGKLGLEYSDIAADILFDVVYVLDGPGSQFVQLFGSIFRRQKLAMDTDNAKVPPFRRARL